MKKPQKKKQTPSSLPRVALDVLIANAAYLKHLIDTEPEATCPEAWVDELEQACLVMDKCIYELDCRLPEPGKES